MSFSSELAPTEVYVLWESLIRSGTSSDFFPMDIMCEGSSFSEFHSESQFENKDYLVLSKLKPEMAQVGVPLKIQDTRTKCFKYAK